MVKPYLYRLEADFTHPSPQLAGIAFCNEWCAIEDGQITIAAGYAWDGCSPKWVLGRWVIGTPDGPMMPDGWCQTGQASLVHDVLCQFKDEIPIAKAAAVALFEQQLAEARWPYRRLYVWAVDWFGPQVFAGDRQRKEIEYAG